MFVKLAEREEARQLRRDDGLAMRVIAELGLPPTSIRAATVNRPSSASRWRRNVLTYGTATTCVYSTFIVQSIYGAIQEYAGFERPEWLD